MIVMCLRVRRLLMSNEKNTFNNVSYAFIRGPCSAARTDVCFLSTCTYLEPFVLQRIQMIDFPALVPVALVPQRILIRFPSICACTLSPCSEAFSDHK